MYAENLAKMSIPAVFDSGCFGESFKYLNRKHKLDYRSFQMTSAQVLSPETTVLATDIFEQLLI